MYKFYYIVGYFVKVAVLSKFCYNGKIHQVQLQFKIKVKPS